MKESVRAATLTMYHHAYGLTEIARPPMTLGEAVERLLHEAGAEGESRRRRVVAKLVGAGLDLDAEHREALDRLVPQLHGVSWEGLIPHLRDLDRFIAETAIIGQLATILGSVGCNRTYPNTITGVDWVTGKTWVEVSLRVGRTLTALARVIDAQTWDECSPYFEAAFVPKRTSLGTVTIDPVTHYPEEHSSPPNRGSTWQELFFEHFESVMPLGGVSVASSFHNLLSVETRFPDADTFRMEYSLSRSVWSRLGLSEMAGGLDVDEGFGQARLDPDGWVTVTGRKTVRFVPRPLFPAFHLWLNNGGAEVALRAMGDEFYEAVCC